jgi:hypothetical protein
MMVPSQLLRRDERNCDQFTHAHKVTISRRCNDGSVAIESNRRCALVDQGNREMPGRRAQVREALLSCPDRKVARVEEPS